MATSRESRLASIAEEADNTIKVSRAEFWKLMQHEDEDYMDPDFAGMIDWPSTKVEHPVPARLGPNLDCHYQIEGTPIRFQQSKLNLGHNSSGHSDERIFAETSPKDHLKERRSRAIRLEDENEDDPTDEDVPQFHRHFEGDETDQHDPEGKVRHPNRSHSILSSQAAYMRLVIASHHLVPATTDRLLAMSSTTGDLHRASTCYTASNKALLLTIRAL